MEPVYAQLLDPVETLEMVVEGLEVNRCKVLVEVYKEATAVRQQPVRSDLGQHLDRGAASVSAYVPLPLSESQHLPVLLPRQVYLPVDEGTG